MSAAKLNLGQYLQTLTELLERLDRKDSTLRKAEISCPFCQKQLITIPFVIFEKETGNSWTMAEVEQIVAACAGYTLHIVSWHMADITAARNTPPNGIERQFYNLNTPAN